MVAFSEKGKVYPARKPLRWNPRVTAQTALREGNDRELCRSARETEAGFEGGGKAFIRKSVRPDTEDGQRR